MMYPYITFSDETLITHSHIMEREGQPLVLAHFERPTKNGFVSARCEIPSYHWLFNDGFTKCEIEYFNRFLQDNAHLLFRFAKQGGIRCV